MEALYDTRDSIELVPADDNGGGVYSTPPIYELPVETTPYEPPQTMPFEPAPIPQTMPFEPAPQPQTMPFEPAPQPQIMPFEPAPVPQTMPFEPAIGATDNNMLEIPYYRDASQSSGGSSYAPYDPYVYQDGGTVYGGSDGVPYDAPQISILDQILAVTTAQQNAAANAQQQATTTIPQTTSVPQTTNVQVTTQQQQQQQQTAIALGDSPIVAWLKANKLLVGGAVAIVLAIFLFGGGGSKTIRVIRGD